MAEQTECRRCGGTQNDPEDSTERQYGGWYNEPPASTPCRECVIRAGVLERIRKQMKGPAGATLFDLETLLGMVDELARERDAALDALAAEKRAYAEAAAQSMRDRAIEAVVQANPVGSLFSPLPDRIRALPLLPDATEGSRP